MAASVASVEVGRVLKRAREIAGLTQEALVHLLQQAQTFQGDDMRGLNQPAIARIESGTTSPRPVLVRAWAEICGQGENSALKNQLIAAYVAATFFDIKPSLDSDDKTEKFFLTNSTEILNLSQILAWELSATVDSRRDGAASLWIIAPNFIDGTNPEFLNTVVDKFLASGSHITYFVNDYDIAPDGRFEAFLQQVVYRVRRCIPDYLERTGALGEISCYGLLPGERTWLSSAMAIANPNALLDKMYKTEGYTVVSINGKPGFGVAMTMPDIERIITYLNQQIRLRAEKGNVGIWVAEALKSHHLFKAGGRNDK